MPKSQNVGENITSINFGDKVLKMLDMICVKEDLKRSQIVRRAVALYFRTIDWGKDEKE